MILITSNNISISKVAAVNLLGQRSWQLKKKKRKFGDPLAINQAPFNHPISTPPIFALQCGACAAGCFLPVLRGFALVVEPAILLLRPPMSAPAKGRAISPTHQLVRVSRPHLLDTCTWGLCERHCLITSWQGARRVNSFSGLKIPIRSVG